MIGNSMALLELSLIFSVVVGWGLWELYTLKKGR
jgi:hypothetical protein